MNLHRATQRKSIPIDIVTIMELFTDLILNHIVQSRLHTAKL